MKSLSSFLALTAILFCTESAFAAAKSFSATTISDDVAVRAAADEKSAVLETLKKGTNVTASDRSGAYWKVKLADGKAGFVSVTSLKTKGSVKDLVKGAAAPAAGAAASAVDKAKADAAEKAAAAKAAIAPPAAPAVPAAPAESNAKKLEKAAGGLFKK
jgi:colicin import membrane protein